MVDLTHINMATKEDKFYGVDKWAAFFMADTWEEIFMIAKEMPSLQTSVETLYQLNNDEQIRETCDRFIRAENRERGYKKWIAQQKQELAEQREELAKKDAELASKDAALADTTAELAKLRKEIECLKLRISEK